MRAILHRSSHKLPVSRPYAQLLAFKPSYVRLFSNSSMLLRRFSNFSTPGSSVILASAVSAEPSSATGELRSFASVFSTCKTVLEGWSVHQSIGAHCRRRLNISVRSDSAYSFMESAVINLYLATSFSFHLCSNVLVKSQEAFVTQIRHAHKSAP